MGNEKNPYGFELIMDLHDCNISKFNRKSLKEFFIKICKAINMERCDLHFWDDFGMPPSERETEPHLKGTSAVQFIKTSNIIIHTLDLLKSAYINIFSCKPFNKDITEELTKQWFESKKCCSHFIKRI